MGRLIDACEVVWKINHAIEQVGKASETAAGNEGFNETIKAYKDIRDAIMNAPTVEPERKTGKWIPGRELSRDMIGDCVIAIHYENCSCSECGYTIENGYPLYKFCQNCGADMRGEQDE